MRSPQDRPDLYFSLTDARILRALSRLAWSKSETNTSVDWKQRGEKSKLIPDTYIIRLVEFGVVADTPTITASTTIGVTVWSRAMPGQSDHQWAIVSANGIREVRRKEVLRHREDINRTWCGERAWRFVLSKTTMYPAFALLESDRMAPTKTFNLFALPVC